MSPVLDRIVRLHNPIRDYAWGSRTVIAELLGQASPSPGPQAELWIGAHPGAPSRVGDAAGPSLADAIAADPRAALGPDVAARFGGELPFLLKVLAADAPLSIQAHPDADQAARGFAREEAAGIARDAPERSYRDPRPKPELLCALTPFEAMLGFRPREEIAALLRGVGVRELQPELEALARGPEADALAAFFAALLRLEPARRRRALAEAVAGVRGQRDADRAHTWLLALHTRHPDDVGVLAPLLLNVLTLAPGEAIELGPGELHAYLQGAGVEIMASSDNVLRGGLTKKHMDVPELLRVLRFDAGAPAVLRSVPRGPIVSVYETRATEFSLSRLEIRGDHRFDGDAALGAEILLCTAGAARVSGKLASQALRRGEACFVPASVTGYRLDGDATLFRVTVPTR